MSICTTTLPAVPGSNAKIWMSRDCVFHFAKIINDQLQRRLNAVNNDTNRLPPLDREPRNGLFNPTLLDPDRAFSIDTIEAGNARMHVWCRRASSLSIAVNDQPW